MRNRLKNLSTLFLLLLLMNCNHTKTLDIQGHRGCRGLYPENSIEAFKKAVEIGVHTLELDVVVSKDNFVVVSHEPFMNPTICLDANGNEIKVSDKQKYNLYKMPFDSIKKFDCGSKYHPRFPDQKKMKTHKPSLDEVIKVAIEINPEIKFNIELKTEPEYDEVFTPYPKEFVQLVLEVVNKNSVFKKTNLQSFDLRILEEIKVQSPNMKVALLVDENEDIPEKLKKLSFKPETISPYFKLLKKEMVDNYQNEDYLVIPWTVNSVKEMKLMIDFQVDGIITDYPDRLIDLLKN